MTVLEGPPIVKLGGGDWKQGGICGWEGNPNAYWIVPWNDTLKIHPYELAQREMNIWLDYNDYVMI